MAFNVVGHMIMASIVMASIDMAYILMVYTVMAYIVMARQDWVQNPLWKELAYMYSSRQHAACGIHYHAYAETGNVFFLEPLSSYGPSHKATSSGSDPLNKGFKTTISHVQ